MGGVTWVTCARFRRKGFPSLVGRTKELIKFKGFQVSPMELAALVAEHLLVADTAVGDVWDEEQLTELPTPYVVLKDVEADVRKKGDDLRQVHQDTDSLVSGYKKLRGGVWEVDVVPRNAQTEVLRRELKDHHTGPNSLGYFTASAKL
jgi:4-coumarate--CoA ligase